MQCQGGFRGAALCCRLAVTLALLALVSGCATAPDPSDREAYAEFQATNDPLEPLNRGVFEVNRGLDALILRPAAGFYRFLTPPPIQEAVSNFLRNLRSPIVLANDLMQGEWERAQTTVVRFAINTTAGIGGLGDPATGWGWPGHSEDFGQTLATWGIPEGPFLMLPVIGPSNPRDAVGLAVDNLLLDPIAWYARYHDEFAGYAYARTAATLIDFRAQNIEALDDLERNSLDFYAALRSLYRQVRASEIEQGQRSMEDVGPTLGDFPEFPALDSDDAYSDFPSLEGDGTTEEGPAK